MTDETLEAIALTRGESVEDLLEEITEKSPDELYDDYISHFASLLNIEDEEFEELRFDDDVGRYERGKQSRIKQSTYKQREITVEQFSEWYLENEEQHMTTDVVQSFLDDLKEDGYSTDTIEARYWQLMSFCRDELSGAIESQARDAEIPEPEEDEEEERIGARPIDINEKNTIIDAIDNRRLELCCMILWQCGLRVREVAELRVDEDIDLENQKIHVDTLKEGVDRTLSFNLDLKNELRKWINAERKKHTQAADSDYLFPTKKSDRIYPRNLTQTIREIAEDALDITEEDKKQHQNGASRSPVTPHSFRKGFGLQRLEEGYSIREIQVLYGHKDVSTTQRYLELDSEEIDYTPR